MSEFHACPKCGKSESAWGDNFCGACEERYHAQMEQDAREEIAQLRESIKDHNECEGCSKCLRTMARIYELQGNHIKAQQIMSI